MIVELVGLAGSGKSFLAPVLARQHGVPVIRTHWFGDRYLLAFLFVVLNWSFSRPLLKRAHEGTREIPELRARKRRRFISIAAKEMKARILGGGLIDEGIFQYLLTAYEAPAPSQEYETLVHLLVRCPYRIYLIEADEAVRAHRMEKRKKTPRSHLGPEYQRAWRAVCQQNFTQLKTLLVGAFDATVYSNN